MTEREALRLFGAMKAARHVVEGYGVHSVVISCSRCNARWERDRQDPRYITVNDRLSAVRHLAEEHGIENAEQSAVA